MQSEGINSITAKTRKRNQSLSPKEKILLEKRLDYVTSSNHKGPDLGLFFHELTGNETPPKKIVSILGGIAGFILFLVTFPLLGLLVGLSNKGRLIRKQTCIGIHGTNFTRYNYDIYNKDPGDTGIEEISGGIVERILFKTRLYRLPNFINLVKGDMALVGPTALPESTGQKLNAELTDFYKRFAVKPGIIGIADSRQSYHNTQDFESWGKILEKELYYVAKPNLKKDLTVIFGKLSAEDENQ